MLIRAAFVKRDHVRCWFASLDLHGMPRAIKSIKPRMSDQSVSSLGKLKRGFEASVDLLHESGGEFADHSFDAIREHGCHEEAAYQ